jgi:hypothetical protein
MHRATRLHPIQLTNDFQDWFAGKDLFVARQPLTPHDALLINQEKRPPGHGVRLLVALLHDAVTSNRRKVGMVAEDWEG